MKEYEKLAKDASTWIRYSLNAAGKEIEERSFGANKYKGYIEGFLKALRHHKRASARIVEITARHGIR